ncbi:hypothetical protein [Musicola keenii]|uniref:hypothetical protein n=1 Tax=Musicola keenii TaxID=2884250 RepID=UPI00177C5126|nr:hypothetical protein [Musicola keenii]
MIRLNKNWREGIVDVIGNNDAIVFQQKKLHGVFFNRFNVGLMLFVCIHFFPCMFVNMKSLVWASDRGWRTHRSENAHPVPGSISLATLSPAPFSEVYIVECKAMNLHGFNVGSAPFFVQEGGR